MAENEMSTAENEMRELNNLRGELSTLKKQMTAVQQKIKELEREIYMKCDHVWTIDRTNVGEHTEHVCVHCNMSKTV
jgi:predicted RNase H-like nuclease (RuvC/YqgF family)